MYVANFSTGDCPEGGCSHTQTADLLEKKGNTQTVGLSEKKENAQTAGLSEKKENAITKQGLIIICLQS